MQRVFKFPKVPIVRIIPQIKLNVPHIQTNPIKFEQRMSACTKKLDEFKTSNLSDVVTTSALLTSLNPSEDHYMYTFKIPDVTLMKRKPGMPISDWEFTFASREFKLIKTFDGYVFRHGQKRIKTDFEGMTNILKKLKHIFYSKGIDSEFVAHWFEFTGENINHIDRAYISPFVEHTFEPKITVRKLFY
jgi:hypothetical protein